MPWFSMQAGVVMALLGSLLLTAALAYLSTLPGETTAQRWWAGAFLLNVGRYGTTLAQGVLPPGVVFVGSEGLQAVSSMLLLAGALAYAGRPVRAGWLWGGCALALGWCVGGWYALDFLWTTLPLYGFTGAVLLFAGALFLRQAAPARFRGHAVAGVLLALWGLHKWNYPFLRPVEGFAPWGFLIAYVLSVAVALTLIIITQRRQQAEAEAAGRRVQASEGRLRESERRFRRLIEDSLNGILIHRNKKPLYVNPAFAELFGYDSVDEVLAVDSVDAWVMPEELNRVRGYADERLRRAGGVKAASLEAERSVPARYEFLGRRRDGSPLRVHNTVRTIEWEGEPALMATMYDVTERSRAEEALRLSEGRFRALIEGSIQGIVILRDRKPLFANQAYATMFGFRSPEEVLALDSVDALIAPHEHQRIRRFARERMAGRRAPDRYEFDGRRRDGTLIRVECISSAVVWQGAPAIQSTLVDITERTRAEEHLRRSEQRFRDFSEAASDWFWELDRDLRLTFVSGRVHELFGLAPETLLGQPLEALPGGTDGGASAALREALAARRPFKDAVIRLRAHDGAVRVMGVSGLPVLDAAGAFAGFRGTATDITREVEARERAESAHARLVDAIESLPAAFMLYDADERLVMWNSRAREHYDHAEQLLIAGITFEELVRRNITLNHQEPARSGHLEAWVRQRLADFRDPPGAYDRRRSDGRWTRVIDHKTRDGGTVCLRFDVTELKQREEELRQAHKMEALGKLTGGVAHDFNNLLQVIAGYTALALSCAESGEPVAPHLERVQQAAERATGLTRQLLAVSRKQVLRRADVDLNDAIVRMADMFQRVIGEDIQLEVRPARRLHNIYADPSMVEQVLMNLILNARDAMPAGGRLVIATANVDTVTGEDGPAVCLSCTDTGVGMAPEVAERVFEPFYTTKETGKGTGLGLSIVYGIVRQHEGWIDVDSAPGQGTTFRVYFPAREAQAVPAAAAGEPQGAGRGETILVAEDDDDVRALTVEVLGDSGYRVITAADGEDALSVFRERAGRIELVLLDVIMPRMSGREAYREMRRLQPHVRVLFSSGYSDDQVDFVDREGMALIQKPYTPEQLLRAVREALSPAAAAGD